MNLLSKEILVVAFGGALGSVCRFLLSRWVQILIPYENLPWGIIVVNILGCFSIGILYSLFSYHPMISPLWRVGLMIGILGGFTTFSSFTLDTIHLLEKGSALFALLNVLISLVVCLFATEFGVWITRALHA